jgi:hypothetical protein
MSLKTFLQLILIVQDRVGALPVLAASRGVDDPALWLDAPFDFEGLDRLVYLQAVISETLCLYHSMPEDSNHVVADVRAGGVVGHLLHLLRPDP